MTELVFATNNRNKLQEVQDLVPEEILLLNLDDIGCSEEIPETAPTIEGNALQKATYVAEKYEVNCFADDTGLEVQALHGEPGVYSARYAGPDRSSEDNMTLLLQKLEGQADRSARFKTVIALSLNGKTELFEGIVNGTILTERKGEGGFGYDPVFLPDGAEKTFAEMTRAEKNGISHRAIALEKLRVFLASAR